MCTLILGRDVIGPRTVLLAANRDEDPARPSEPPILLAEGPRRVGGRDRRAGGTWLAIRPDGMAVALLNRRAPDTSDPATRRSRGLLALDVAGAVAGPDGADSAIAAARVLSRSLARDSYAPFSIVVAAPGACWWAAHPDGGSAIRPISAGWHVLTHQDLDDPAEPRTAWLVERLRSFRPSGEEEAVKVLQDLLRGHGEGGAPAVCLHEGLMVTVSSSLVKLGEEGLRYLHAEGPPCETEYRDHSRLLGIEVRS